MITRTHNRFAVAAASALSACAATALVAGCASDSEGGSSSTSTKPWAQQWTPGMESGRTPATTATTLPPQVAGVNRHDPDAVALAAMTVWFTWDTARDSGPDDATARTAPLLTESYAKALTSGAPQGGPGADWMGWSAQRARLIARTRRGAEPVPPATVSTAYAQVVVDQAVTLPDNTVTGHIETVVAVVLNRGTQGWEVASVQRR